MKAAIYARVSARDQKSVPDQIADLRKLADLKGWSVVAEYEEVETGKKNNRPIREQLLKKAMRSEFDAVLVWKIDRWGRNAQDLMFTITAMYERGVAFVSFCDAVDLSTAQGRLIFQILAVFAEFERETIVERVRAGVRKYRERNGGEWGRSPTARAKAAEVRELAAAGMTKTAIAARVGIGRTSVGRILSDAKLHD